MPRSAPPRSIAELVPEAVGQPAATVLVSGITADSRTVRPGDLFVALEGQRGHGMKFAAAAAAAGATAILTDAAGAASTPASPVPLLVVPSPRRALAIAAARLYAVQPATAVAVTGTSGKTSVAEFTRQIFAEAGYAAASLGTLGVVKPGGAVYGSLTTPDPVTLHETLAGLATEGITHLAFEASSHGLDQHRLDGVALTAAAFTNLGRDHLDYHATEADYLAAKLRLFSELLRSGQTAVVNADGARAGDVIATAEASGLAVMTVGRNGRDLRLVEHRREGFAQVLAVEAVGRRHDVRLPLVGDYQVENALVAAGLAMAAGVGTEAALRALGKLEGVPGRLDVVGEKTGALVVVDYAHKPEALAAAIAGVRPFVTGRLICVMGCGGDRDKGKRPIMGRIAAENADIVIITDDNPRTEDAAAIRAEILAGVPFGVGDVTDMDDRGAAIRAAVNRADKGDVVLICGKGHETGQIVGTKVFPFSDHEVARAAIEESARG
ncbi:MAG: UDP-N-acetylmuramoyl-L-alanyl-D-glutamate--2,6-diaminopimelate ligase [Hyphomicrobiaceae bacterium]|nr:UDP-N-acetylmuramoyl-L-alanyl-D-glutamate--2,6-diaminopimelate ligase [Hyphomicrobiaceae bacterium]